MVVTSTADLNDLKGALSAKGVTEDILTGVQYAGTPYHGGAVYGLGGFRSADGRRTDYDGVLNAGSASADAWPISNAGISDPTALTAWFYIARGNYEAMGSIAKAARRSGEVGEQASLLVERVTSLLQTRAEAITTPIADIENYDAAVRLVADIEASGLRDLRDLKTELSNAVRAADREDALSDELTARRAYLSCVAMLPKGLSQQRKARDGFQQIAERFGSTAYGRRAQQRVAHLDQATRQ